MSKERVYDIYRIPKKKRKQYQMHHIVFRSDPKRYECFKDFDVNNISNLYPLKIEEHTWLHKKVERDEK